MTTPANASLAESLSSLPEQLRQEALKALADEEVQGLLYDWRFWARPKQLAPSGDWRTWLILAGRGFGKSRTGAEWVRAQVESGNCSRLALVAPTAADARDVMVEGESGVIATANPRFKPVYEPSKRRITWPSGVIATIYTADEPDRLRGPQHDGAWCDEISSWRYPAAWDMLMMGLRLGRDPRVVVTTTPKPIKLVRDLMAAKTTVVTRGTTYENLHNLAPAFAAEIIARYEGTRLGRQELLAEVLDDVPGALWTRDMVEDHRVKEAPQMVRVVVGVDPAVTSGDDSDETGIIVAGKGIDGHAYVLSDRSCQMSPDGWGRRAVIAFHEFRADRLVAETNNGGEMVELTIRTIDKEVSFKAVHATRGKRVRAEPVAALYEQGRVHHVGAHPKLEDQMVAFLPEGSDEKDDRVDALVWALTELMLDNTGESALAFMRERAAALREQRGVA